MYSVDLKNVTKKWGDVTAVDQVNLHINEGEFVVLLGCLLYTSDAADES